MNCATSSYTVLTLHQANLPLNVAGLAATAHMAILIKREIIEALFVGDDVW